MKITTFFKCVSRMRKVSCRRVFVSIACAAACTAPLALTGSNTVANGDPRRVVPAPVEVEEMPVPSPDVPQAVKRTNSVTRGGPELRVFLFAPRRSGATAREHPVFYWYLTRQIEDDTEIIVTSRPAVAERLDSSPVLMRKLIQGTQPPGIYSAGLESKALDPHKIYQISVVVHRSGDNGNVEDVTSVGYLIFKPGPQGAAASSDARACARAGLWYDAIDASMQRIGAGPADPTPHRELHGLLWGEHVFYADPGDHAEEAAVERARREDEDFLKQLAARQDVLVKRDAALNAGG